MSDLIERLINADPDESWTGPTGIMTEAADEIERLTADNEKMREVKDQKNSESFDLHERIAKLKGALNWFRFNSTPEGMARAIEALQEKPDE